MGPRARITTDDGGGIDQAVSRQLASPVKIKTSRGLTTGHLRASGERAVVMIVVVIVIAAAVVVAAAAVVTTEVRETTAAKRR